MYGYYTLWRRKKMRYVIAGCLGISVLVSLMMVIGSPAMTLGDDAQAQRLRDYAGSYKGLVIPRRNDKGLQLSFGGNRGNPGHLDEAGLRKALYEAPGAKHVAGPGDARHTGDHFGDDPIERNDGYDDRDDNNDDDSYYDDGHDNGHQETLDIRRVLDDQKNDGFVMEDNAADYDQDSDDQAYDYEDEDDRDNYPNPPFKPGDFDYSLLNGTEKPTVRLKLAGAAAAEAKHTKPEKIHKNLKLNNRSHLYNEVQYKTMHLLENTVEREQTGQRPKNDSKQHFQKQPKLHLVHVTRQSGKTAEDPAAAKLLGVTVAGGHRSPCLGASNCGVSDSAKQTDASGKFQYNKDVGQRIEPINIHGPEPGSLVDRQRQRVQHSQRINNNLDIKVRQSSHMPDKDGDRNGFVHNNANKGQINIYRKSNTGATPSHFIGQNVIFHQRIETQIPIQDGGVDANWLLQEQPATQIQMPELPWQPGEVRSPEGIPLIVDKIYWSREVEDLVPAGVTNENFQHFLHKLDWNPVKEMHAPQWNRCGRPSNQYLILRDNTKLCARFREEHVKLLHGEVLSFYFSRILGLDNVPIVVLSEANSGAPQWLGMNITGAGWNESSIVALIQWIDGLESEKSRVRMPTAILQAYENGGVFDHHHKGVHHLKANNLTELVQWSDMILFDYLTGHYDRVASMQDGADREHKPSIMHESIRNLRKVWQSSKMWLIDNESGLFDGYELLYQGGEMGRKFVEFHVQMLRTNCIFRRQTVDKIFQLANMSSPTDVLVRYAGAQDPLYQHLPYTKEIQLFKKYLPVRLKQVVDWIKKCQAR